MTQLSLAGLQKYFGNVHALQDIDLEVAQGEFISLLGPSGCGKTTTLRCAAGFEFPDAGSIRFDGRDVTALPPEKRDIGMVFQNYALFPHMTVRQNLSFGLEMRMVAKDAARARIDRMLEMVQLGEMAHRYPRQLSGGQQQRVALARALVIEPKVLLLDEPLANLDAVLRDEMRFFIRELQQRVGITALYVTHDQSEAMVMSDRIVVMFDGRIAQTGSPEDIHARPRGERIAKFVGRANLIDGTVDSCIDGHLHRLSTPLGPVVGRHDAKLQAGACVKVAVRPAAMSLCVGRAGSDGANQFACRVERTFYTGGVVEHLVRAGGQSFTAVSAPAQAVAAGNPAFISFAPSDAWIMAEQGQALPGRSRNAPSRSQEAEAPG